jgi:diacylglycerol kinase family enzyme
VPGKLVSWTVEACIGLQPLNVIMAQDRPPVMSLPAGSVAVFSAQLELEDGPWHAAVTVFMGDEKTKTVVIGA